MPIPGGDRTLAAGSTCVWSFDVYDTCVSRDVARPRDLFFLAGLSLAPPGLPPLLRHALASLVMWSRATAEGRALRAARGREAVTLDEIYDHLWLPRWSGITAARLRARELRLERDCLYAVPRNRARLAALRDAGARVVFSSDMYLPAPFIRQQLVRLGVATGEEPLFVSGALGVTKRSGGLFGHLVRDVAVAPDAIIHVGDDPVADARVPAGLGLRVAPYPSGRPNRHERMTRARRALGDPVLPLFLGLSRKARLLAEANGGPSDPPLPGFLISVVGPFLTAFVCWVLRAANGLGLDRLYFVARDGQVLLALARLLSERLGGPELRYLYGSRRAWLEAQDQGATPRATALGYLEQEGLFADGHWALVDVGWGLNCQGALRCLLASRDPRAASAVRGLYVGFARDHAPAAAVGPASAMLPGPGSLLARRRVVFEHLFTPGTDQPTVGYARNGAHYAPVFGTEARRPDEVAFARRLQAGLLTYATLALGCEAIWTNPARYQAWAIAGAYRLLLRPDPEEARAVAALSVNADARHEAGFQDPMCRPLRWADALAITRAQLTGTSAGQRLPAWLEASAALSPAPLRAAVGLLVGADQVRNLIRGRTRTRGIPAVAR